MADLREEHTIALRRALRYYRIFLDQAHRFGRDRVDREAALVDDLGERLDGQIGEGRLPSG